MKSKLLLIFFSFVFVAFFLMPKNVFAQETGPFETNYLITYDIQPTGETLVTQDISVINRAKDVAATTYTLTIKKMNIFDVVATRNGQELETEITQGGDETIIKVIFDDPVLGENRKNDFAIKYNTYDIAYKIGEVWNVNVPKVNLLETTNEYEATLIVPSSFGPEIFVSPDSNLFVEETNNTTYSFNKDLLENKGITASFGEYQVINFKLDYSLQNDSHFDTTQQIALPPDIENMQQIAYKSIEPTPDKLFLDDEGNVIAEYLLEAKEVKDITVIGTARILGQQINPEFGGSFDELPNSYVGNYTQPTMYWHSDSPEIVEIANTLKDENLTVAQNAQLAYNFVTQNLEYDFEILKEDVVERKGSINALASTELTSCMEFTDLYIAVLRAMGIPAREINGFAISNDTSGLTPLSIDLMGGDVLHSWVEYYDPEFGWLPVDPTWGSTSEIDYFTKLDTNHLAFVIKGKDPIYPLPAGAYKTNNDQQQVFVDFAQNPDENDFNISLSRHDAITANPVLLAQNLRYYHIRNNSYIPVYYENEIILPGNFVKVSLKNGTSKLDVRDSTGNEILIELEESSEKLENTMVTVTILALSMLLLCGMFYALVTHRQSLKTKSLRLSRRLRGQDQ